MIENGGLGEISFWAVHFIANEIRMGFHLGCHTAKPPIIKRAIDRSDLENRLQNLNLNADRFRRAKSQAALTGGTTASHQAEFARPEHLSPVFVEQH